MKKAVIILIAQSISTYKAYQNYPITAESIKNKLLQ